MELIKLAYNKCKEKPLSVFLIFLSIIFLLNTYLASWTTISYTKAVVGPAFFPRTIVIMLLISSIIYFLIPKGKVNEDFIIRSNEEKLIIFLFLISSIVLIFSILKIGIIFSIFIYTFFWMYFFKVKPIKKIIILSLFGSIFLYLLFNFADIYFPEPLLF